MLNIIYAGTPEFAVPALASDKDVRLEDCNAVPSIRGGLVVAVVRGDGRRPCGALPPPHSGLLKGRRPQE